ncbi:uncharacterized protein [Mycetomoellerius zeteki]|uniref:uncharacterized protein n=1 Tax=Mycetomoellerius zeteki TaxID=64791 RepID=UPI00084EA6D7|nr:PREDICTED: uncharacterized protein LOC108727104 [Trachymyrmex zeteki]
MSVTYASRYEAVFLCTHPKGPKMSQYAAAKYMQKSKSFVQKWVQRYFETKTVDDLPERGTARVFTGKDVKRIVSLFEKKKNSMLSLRQGQAILKKNGLKISCETIRRYLRLHGVKTQRNKEADTNGKTRENTIHLGKRK